MPSIGVRNFPCVNPRAQLLPHKNPPSAAFATRALHHVRLEFVLPKTTGRCTGMLGWETFLSFRATKADPIRCTRRWPDGRLFADGCCFGSI